MLVLYLLCGAAGTLFGLLVSIFHSAMQDPSTRWGNIVCGNCKAPPKQNYASLIINSFLNGKCFECSASWPQSYYACSILSAVQFVLIAWRSESAISLALLSLLTLCFIFLMLNEIYKQAILQKEVYILSGVLTCVHAMCSNVFFMQIVCIIVFMCVAIALIQLCSRLFIRNNCIPHNEVMMTLLSSILIPINLLPNYLFLLSIISFLWALCCRIIYKSKLVPLMPAFIITLWICLLFSKSTLVVMFNF